jgi:exonuclease SbcC
MLTKIEIENFQSHKNTVMEFIPGTNVLIGKSDHGKSGVIRALNWMIENRPLGDAFRSEWGGDTRVGLHTSDGHLIERIRSASKNEYILDGQVLKAFGAEVPEEIRNILQIDSFHIQMQEDPSFLLSHTPGEAARILNKAASIDDIDITISGIKGDLSKINTDIKYNERQLDKYNQEMEQYENLSKIEEAIIQVEALEKEREGLAKDLTGIKRVKEKIKQVELILEEGKHVPALLEKIIQAEGIYQEYQKQASSYNRLKGICSQIKQIQKSLKQTKEVDQALKLAGQVEKDFFQYEQDKKQGQSLKKIMEDIQEIQNTINRTDKKIIRLEKEYAEAVPETCPLCGAKIPGGK